MNTHNFVKLISSPSVLLPVGILASWIFSASEANAAVHQCISRGVAVFSNRIHVECTVPANSRIRFFALGTSDSAHTARILTVLTMAHVHGKPLAIEYNPNDTSGAAIGCQTSDCRLILSATMLP